MLADKMDKDRHSEWIENSFGLMHVEMLLINDAQGLGALDVELIEEFPRLKIDSKLEKDLSRKYRHILLSKLWVIGAYELIRVMDKMMPKDMEMYKEDTIKKLKEVLSAFTEVRIPLAKFQDRGKGELYSGVSLPHFDSTKGMGWKIHFSRKAKVETKIFYRKDLSDSLFNLLKKLKEDIRAETNVARQ